MTKAKSSVFTDFVAPIGVLTIICLVMAALLAFTNGVTAPIIAATEARAAEEARMEVLPEADSFELVTADGLPDSVTEVYKAANGSGYVFSITATGYGGKNTLKLAVGIDMDGKITGTKVLGHKETVGLGAKIETPDFQSQFPGQGADYVSSIDNIDTISGATRSSNFFRLALADAFTAFDLVKEGA